MISQKIQIKNFPAVSNTSIMTLYCRAMDYNAKNSILKDKFAYDLYKRIEFDWNQVKKRVHNHDYVLIAIRVRKFDSMCKEFLQKNPKGIIVSLGAGLDNRYTRIDNNRFTMVDIEFPAVLELKSQLIPPSSRNIYIPKSVLDYTWIRDVMDLCEKINAPVFFIAEGLIPYIDKLEIKELFQNICKSFPMSEIFFDVCGEKSVQRMSKHSGIQEWEVKLVSGFKSGQDFEEWTSGFKLIGEWYYPNDPDAKKGLMKLMWVIPTFKYWLFFLHGKFE